MRKRMTVALRFLAVAFCYYAAARIGLLLDFEATNATPVWPPSGIALAALLTWGWRIAPAIFCGAFAVNVVVYAAHLPVALSSIMIASGCIGMGNMLEGLLAAWICRSGRGEGFSLGRVRDVIWFVVAATTAGIIAATIGATSIVWLGLAPAEFYRTIWLTWWLGDVSGILVVTPVIVSWLRDANPRWNARRAIEGALAFLLLVVAIGSNFGGRFATSEIPYPFIFLTSPFLIWIALRFGPRTTTSALLVVAVIAVLGTINGTGPFVRSTVNESLILLQAFVSVHTALILTLAAVVAERRVAEAALVQAHGQLERQVAERTAQLRETVSELEAFSYTISHDLRAPLRAIQGFAETLLEECGQELGAAAQGYAKHIVSASRRLDLLIQDLLVYSRLSRTDLPVADIPLETAVDTAVNQIAEEVRRRGAIVTVERPLATVRGHEATLVQAIANLLSNAIKFVKAGVTPRVRIGADVDGRRVRCWIEDNGIGIETKYYDRIFQVFERLHTFDQYPGTGIGLAIVRKGIERMGGRVNVASQPGEGSRFWFELPRGVPASLSPSAQRHTDVGSL